MCVRFRSVPVLLIAINLVVPCACLSLLAGMPTVQCFSIKNKCCFDDSNATFEYDDDDDDMWAHGGHCLLISRVVAPTRPSNTLANTTAILAEGDDEDDDDDGDVDDDE